MLTPVYGVYAICFFLCANTAPIADPLSPGAGIIHTFLKNEYALGLAAQFKAQPPIKTKLSLLTNPFAFLNINSNNIS